MNPDYLIGKIVRATTVHQLDIKGTVILVYTDAIASGVNAYVPVTYLSITADDGRVHVVRPRDVHQIITTHE
jgi:hypothetical protein